MREYSAWRASQPGLWLFAALAAEIATYSTASGRSVAVMPWLLLDLWLALRIWRHGAIALAVFRFLQVLAVTLFGLVLVLSHWGDHIGTTTGPGTAVLWALSTWCLFAPALSLHVGGVRQRASEATVP